MEAFGRVLRFMALGGGVVLVALMGYTVLDVVLRYGFNKPFSGSLEVTEFAMALIVFFGIAHCGWTGGHVAVDILERPLENPRLRFIPILLALGSATLFALIAWLTALEALSSRHRVSNMVRWPEWPVQLSVAGGSGSLLVITTTSSVRHLRS